MINNNWIFGEFAGLDFNNNNVTPIIGSVINTAEGCASISDSAGNLLLYTDGIYVWDGNHIRINNSDTLQALELSGNSSSSQSAIIVPRPGANNEYFIFTVAGSTSSAHPNPLDPLNPPPIAQSHLRGVLINLNTTPPLTTLYPNFLFGNPPVEDIFSPTEKVTAIQHGNCRDFWIITLIQANSVDNSTQGFPGPRGDGIFRIFLLTDTIFTHFGDIPFVDALNDPIQILDQGYLKANNTGNLIAFGNANPSAPNDARNCIHLLQFNNLTGQIDIPNLRTIIPPLPPGPNTMPQGVYGIEFSPNSSFLYYTTNFNNGLYQVNLSNPDPLTSTQIGSIPSTPAYRALQIGPDNIIYIAINETSFIGAIITPDLVSTDGSWIPVNDNQINLGTSPTQCRNGLPNLIPNRCNVCNCDNCFGCNSESEQQNDELLQRAQVKSFIIPSNNNSVNCVSSPFPIPSNCQNQAIINQAIIEPCFYFHWGDGVNDQIEEHDTEVFYITVCNYFSDVLFKGLRFTMVRLIPNLSINSAHVVPDRFINIECLDPCSCQTREFAIITRDTNIAGDYTIEIEYCYDEIVLSSKGGQGSASFPLTITED